MSRCFPYPPPGYEKNGIRGQALIELIKVQREEEKAKKERKIEKKREEKEKEKSVKSEKKERDESVKSEKKSKDSSRKSEKHEKEKSEKSVNDECEKQRHKKRRHDQVDQHVGDCLKIREHEIAHVEKSSLTEEHERPVGSQYSSDSSLNSSKRLKQSFSTDDMHSPGSIIRVRLPIQRAKDPEVLPQLPVQRQRVPEVRPIGEQPHTTASRRGDNTCAEGGHKPARLLDKKREQVLPKLPLQRQRVPEVLPSTKQPHIAVSRIADNTGAESWHKPACSLDKKQEQVVPQLPLQRQRVSEVPPVKEQVCPTTGRIVDNKGAKSRHKPIRSLDKKQEQVLPKLPLKRQRVPEVPPVKEQLCTGNNTFAERRHETAYSFDKKKDQHPWSTSRDLVNDSNSSLVIKGSFSLPGGSEILAGCLKKSNMPSKLLCNCSPSFASKLNDIVESWGPPVYDENTAFDNEDQGWLFETKQQQLKQDFQDERFKSDIKVTSNKNFSPWPPGACYMAEADIYVLPFTVPY